MPCRSRKTPASTLCRRAVQALPAPPRLPSQADRAAFTLVELLVAMAVLAAMSVVLVAMVSSVQKVTRQTSSKVEQFRESRRAFDRINQRLSQATLNTYYDYVDADGNPRTAANAATFNPSRYARVSELRYLQTNADLLDPLRGGDIKGQTVFFQAPLGQSTGTNLSGLDSLLNTIGYYIEKGADTSLQPPPVRNASLPAKNRYRLYECVQPAENFSVYSHTSGNATITHNTWLTDAHTLQKTHPLAENIVALVFTATYPDVNGNWTTADSYSSAPRGNSTQTAEENNLPPKVRVGMIAVDEPSAARIEADGITLSDPLNHDSLEDLEGELIENNLNFRRFESTVTIGPAKWSTQ